MELLLVFTPGILASCLLEVLQKRKLSGASFLKATFIFDLFTNLCAVFFYHYIFRGEYPILEKFSSNRFLLFYGILTIVLACILSILYYLAAPHIHLSITTAEKKKEKKNEEKHS